MDNSNPDNMSCRSKSSSYRLPVRSLIFVLIVLSLTPTSRLIGQVNGVYREVYSNIGAGVTINDLTTAAIYPNSPSSTGYLTSFEAPIDVADNYGQRCRALLLPPVTGNYVLWVSSDDASDLYLSSTENPANKTRIAFVSAWTSPREWSKEANQQSCA